MGIAEIVVLVSAILLGIVAAILPLGPVTVLVLRRALVKDVRGAMWIALGRVPTEIVYGTGATYGMVALLDAYPGARLGVEILGTFLFYAFGFWLVVEGPKPPPPEGDEIDPETNARARKWGNMSGLMLSVVNPTPLLSWSTLVGALISMLDYHPTAIDKLSFPFGLGLGIAVGYAGMIVVVQRLDPRVVRQFLRVMGFVFLVIAVGNTITMLR